VATPAELLAEVPFFALLDDQERTALADRLDVTELKAGSMLFNYGDPGETMYILRSGAVELFFKNDVGERIVFETARAGDFFGELSLLDGGPRTLSALVMEDMEALVIDRGDLDEFMRLRPAAAMDLLAATGRRLRESSLLLRRASSKDINRETEERRTTTMKVADWIAAASGSIPFLMIHCLLFGVWIVLNIGLVKWGDFDPFPFGLLTMVVSLEAIILSVFVLLSQNRQASRERVRNDIEYETNLKAELEIVHLHEKLDHVHAEILGRLASLEKQRK
jgi:CRP/FNR family transcriptional regulator, cyclic AMP receptor protein